jgi:hypothetical protein
MWNRELKERIKLLEYENYLLSNKLKEIEKQLKPIMPSFPFPRLIREDGIDLSYEHLRKKYRDFDVIYKDGL